MCDILKSSIGRKMLTAVTGIFLFLFVVGHLLGNLQIFLGPEWLNNYAEHLKNLPLLVWPTRIILLAALVVHFGTSLRLAKENRAARPVPYYFKDTVQASFASRSMVPSGLLIFLFIVYHLLHFTWGVVHPDYFHLSDAQGHHDVYSMVVLSFQNAAISGVYILAMAALGLHLSHALPGFFQSLGWANEKIFPKIRLAGESVAWLIFIGYASIPVTVLLGILKLPVRGMGP